MTIPLPRLVVGLMCALVCPLVGITGAAGQEIGKWELFAKDYAELTGRVPPADAEQVLAFLSQKHPRTVVRYLLSTGTSWNITTYFAALSEQQDDGSHLGRLVHVSIEQASREVRAEQVLVLISGIACDQPLPAAEVEKILLAGRPVIAERKEFSPSRITAVTAEDLADEAPAGARWCLTGEKKLIDRAKGTAALVIYLSDTYEVLSSSVVGSIE